MLCHILILKSSRTITTEIKASVDQQHMNTQKIGDILAHEKHAIISSVENCTEKLSTRAATIEDQISRSRDEIISHVNQISSVSSPNSLDASAIAQRLTQNDRLIEQRFRHFVAEQDLRMQMRDAQSEQRFRHLERVFRTVVAPSVVAHATTDRASSSERPDFCVASGTTCCGRDTFPRNTNWSLCGFKSSIGSVVFKFQGIISAPTASAKRHVRVGIIYTFPAWLFHAAVSVSFSDLSGSPEMNLRILRRVQLRANILSHAQRGDIEAIKNVLVRRHSSIHDVSHVDGRSALHFAVELPLCGFPNPEDRFLSLIRLLLAEGADFLQVDDSGRSPCTHIIKLLYAHPAGVMPRPFCNRLESALPMSRIVEYCGFTRLHKAVLGITEATISPQYLLRSGISEVVDAIDDLGQTALSYASARGDVATVKALLEAGAATNCPASSVQPLAYACRHGNLAVVRMLLAAGADVNTRGRRGSTALLFACTCDRPRPGDQTSKHARAEDAKSRLQIVHQLLAHGADRYALNVNENSALDQAVSSDTGAPVAEFLMEKGLDPDHQDRDGTNALANAIYWDACESAFILLRHGTDLSILDNVGDGILHYLARYGKVEMMNVFIRSDLVSSLDTRPRNHEGRTPLQLFDDREDSTNVMLRDTFWELLRTAALRAKPGVVEGGYVDCEGDEFFDAFEENQEIG